MTCNLRHPMGLRHPVALTGMRVIAHINDRHTWMSYDQHKNKMRSAPTNESWIAVAKHKNESHSAHTWQRTWMAHTNVSHSALKRQRTWMARTNESHSAHILIAHMDGTHEWESRSSRTWHAGMSVCHSCALHDKFNEAQIRVMDFNEQIVESWMRVMGACAMY